MQCLLLPLGELTLEILLLGHVGRNDVGGHTGWRTCPSLSISDPSHKATYSLSPGELKLTS